MENVNIKIEEMIVDRNFQNFIKKFESPNFFKIVGKSRDEGCHSNFIKWLLDPTENHGLKDFALSRLIILLKEKCAKKGISISIDKSDIQEIVFKTEECFGEYGRADIFGVSPQSVLVIENKIDASEHDSQTDKYFAYCEKKYENKKRVYVYLSPDQNAKPSNNCFISITYQDFYDYIIEKCISNTVLKNDARILIEHYAINLSNLKKRGKRLAYTERELASKVYGKYKTLFEEIKSVVNSNDSKENSLIAKLYEDYKVYINEILEILGEDPIQPNKREPDEKNVAYHEYWKAFEKYWLDNADEGLKNKVRFNNPECGQSWLRIDICNVKRKEWHVELKVHNDKKIWVEYYGKKSIMKYFKREFGDIWIVPKWAEITNINIEEMWNRYEDTVDKQQNDVTISFYDDGDYCESDNWIVQFNWYLNMLKFTIDAGEKMYDSYLMEI